MASDITNILSHLKNKGNVVLSVLTLNDSLVGGNGSVLSFTNSPTLNSSIAGSAQGTLTLCHWGGG